MYDEDNLDQKEIDRCNHILFGTPYTRTPRGTPYLQWWAALSAFIFVSKNIGNITDKVDY